MVCIIELKSIYLKLVMDRFKKFAIHLSLLLALLFSASSAHAEEELNIPQPLKHEGLTFEQPLPEGMSIETLAIDSNSFQKLEFRANLDDIGEEPEATPTPTEKPEASTTPSPTPSKQVAKLVTPTLAPSPTPTPIKSGPTTAPPTTTQPTQTGSNTSNGGLNADVLFSMSNNYRAGRGLPPFQTDARICSLAAQRAPEIAAEISEGHMHSGKNSHNFPYWFNENIITMRSEAEAFNWWVNDPIHHDAIVGNYTHSCVACSGTACVQEFTNFQPK